jgi:hypothetical protein
MRYYNNSSAFMPQIAFSSSKISNQVHYPKQSGFNSLY